MTQTFYEVIVLNLIFGAYLGFAACYLEFYSLVLIQHLIPRILQSFLFSKIF